MQVHLIKNLRTNISELKIKDKGEKIPKAIYATTGEVKIYLLAEADEQKEKLRLEKEISNLEKMIKTVANKLSNQEFINKAPKQIVEKEKEKLQSWKIELEKLKK